MIYPAPFRARISQKVEYEWKYAGKEKNDLNVYWFAQYLRDKSKNLTFVFGFILRGINYIQHNICPFNYFKLYDQCVKYICCVIIQLLPLFISSTFSFFQTGALCPLNSYLYSPSQSPWQVLSYFLSLWILLIFKLDHGIVYFSVGTKTRIFPDYW